VVEWTAEVYFPDTLVMSSDSDEAASAEGGIICEFCGLPLASVKIALQHMMEVHLEERSFPCPNANEGCKWAFKRKSHQKRHLPICRYRKVTLFLSVTDSPRSVYDFAHKAHFEKKCPFSHSRQLYTVKQLTDLTGRGPSLNRTCGIL